MNQQQVTVLLIRELIKLSLRLNAAGDQFNPGGPDHGRIAVQRAVLAVKQFVSEVLQEGAELAMPLDQLLYALKDLDAGQVPSLLRPAQIKNRAPDPLSKRLLEAAAATLMDLHMRAGLPRKEAATKAARDLNGAGYRDDKQQTISATQVENWRDKMKAKRDSDDPAAQRYSTSLNLLEEIYPGNAKEQIAFFLDALPSLMPPTIPRKANS